jgi:hypothetical protein
MTAMATPGQVQLRICDGNGERIVAASPEGIEQAFAPGVVVRAGTEISLVDAERTLVALSVDISGGGAAGEAIEFLISRITGEHAALSGPVSRREALRLFRGFMLGTAE